MTELPEQPMESGSPAQVDAVTASWVHVLTEGGYENHCHTRRDVDAARKLGLSWKRALRVTGLRAPGRVFEFGCGGGGHLAKLALNGFEVHGIDASPDVVARARRYLSEVQAFEPIKARVEQADGFAFDVGALAQSFDMAFHVGVVEHFFDPVQRALFWAKLKSLVRPGGWVLSFVPCGRHLLRERVRREGLLGYNVPEIDYGCVLHEAELIAAGLTDVKCLAHNYFGFLKAAPIPGVALAQRPLTALGALVMPSLPVPEKYKERLAHALIAGGRVPLA